jgi:hypothetical protein
LTNFLARLREWVRNRRDPRRRDIAGSNFNFNRSIGGTQRYMRFLGNNCMACIDRLLIAIS